MRFLSYIAIFLFVSTFALGQVQENTRVIAEKNIFFENGKSEISLQSRMDILELYNKWNQNKNTVIELSGHTDANGDEEMNGALSVERAIAAKQQLLSYGVPDNNVVISALGESAPQYSNDHEEGRAQNRRVNIKIHSLEKITYVRGYVNDGETGSAVEGAEIIVSTESSREVIYSDDQGYYETVVPNGTLVRIDIVAEGYFFKTKKLETISTSPLPLKAELPPIHVGDIFPFKNMHFYGDSPKLLPASLKELPVLLKFMKVNKEVKIEIAGHINGIYYPVGKEPPLKFQLSVNRALTVHKYLAENGISRRRMTYKGYGNREMKYPSPVATERQQSINRRVEIRIMGTEEIVSKEIE